MNLKQKISPKIKSVMKSALLKIKNSIRNFLTYLNFEASVPIKHIPIIEIADEIVNQDLKSFKLFKIEDLIVFNKNGFIKKDDRILTLKDLDYYRFKSPHEMYNHIFGLKMPLTISGKSKKLKDAVILFDHGQNNYYHWFFDIISKIRELELSQIDVKNLILPKPKYNFQYETIEILKNKYNVFFTSNIFFYKIKDAYFTELLLEKGKIRADYKDHIDFLKNLLFKKDNFKVNDKFIFIMRKNTINGRNIINLKELKFFLTEKRIKIHYLEKYTLNFQLSLFQGAKIIISPHGAGLTNLIAAKENTHLIELFHVNRPNDLFERIAKIKKINYYSIIDNKFSDSNDPDIYVDIDELDKIYNLIINKF